MYGVTKYSLKSLHVVSSTQIIVTIYVQRPKQTQLESKPPSKAMPSHYRRSRKYNSSFTMEYKQSNYRVYFVFLVWSEVYSSSCAVSKTHAGRIQPNSQLHPHQISKSEHTTAHSPLHIAIQSSPLAPSRHLVHSHLSSGLPMCSLLSRFRCLV